MPAIANEKISFEVIKGNCILSFVDVYLGFTVANIPLPIDNLCIAYDDDIHYTLKHQSVCKSSSGYGETWGTNTEIENKRFISHVNYMNLFRGEISVNHTYLSNKYIYTVIP